MASSYSDLKFELIGTGDQAGTWGATTNTNLGTAIEEAITGSADVAFSSADVTLTLTDTNGTQAARHLRLNLTGTSGGARNLILGSGCQIDKLYIINNGLADTVTVKNTTGTGIAVPAGKSKFVFNDGTNVVEVDDVTPTISLTSGVSGILPVANGGTGISSFGTGVATWLGTPSSANLAAALSDETGSGLAVFNANPLITTARETATIAATATSGTVQFDAITQSVLYHTSNAGGNWTLNIRGNSGTQLNSIMSTGQSMTLVFLATQGSTPYYQSGFTIDGNNVTPKWQNGTAPTSGNASGVDVYVVSIIKTGSGTFNVFESQTQFG